MGCTVINNNYIGDGVQYVHGDPGKKCLPIYLFIYGIALMKQRVVVVVVVQNYRQH